MMNEYQGGFRHFDMACHRPVERKAHCIAAVSRSYQI